MTHRAATALAESATAPCPSPTAPRATRLRAAAAVAVWLAVGGVVHVMARDTAARPSVARDSASRVR